MAGVNARTAPGQSEGLGSVGEAKTGTEGTEGAVAGNEYEAGGEGMSSHKHVHGGERTAPLPRGGAKVSIGSSCSGIPGQHAHAQEELIYELGELCGLGFEGKTEEQLGFGDGRDNSRR